MLSMIMIKEIYCLELSILICMVGKVVWVVLMNDKYVLIDSVLFKFLCILVDCVGVVEFEVKLINVGFENDWNKVNF